jgi:hypothetical protein
MSERYDFGPERYKSFLLNNAVSKNYFHSSQYYWDGEQWERNVERR